MASQSSSASTATNIMLAVYEKKTTSLDLYRPLRNYISMFFSEREAQNLEDDLQTVKQYRSDLERQPDPSPTSRRDLLQKYFKALCLIETRFPISPDNDHINTVTFVWYDAFKQKQKASQQNIHLEKAAVLFNLGAVYSQIGLSFDRATVEGRKQAIHAFIAAAGSFAFLRDNAATKASMGTSTTVDLSVECAGMLERLMLAQAQECVFENTIAKGSTPGVCAKISRQVGLYYEEALAALSVASLKDHFDKGWIAHVQLKAALFYAEACYRYSLELHEKEEIAEEIARLKSASSMLSEVKKSSRGAAAQLLDAISKLEANINRNLDRAVKENDRVYLMRVPSPSSLPPLPAFSMVKIMPMNEVLDASKEKMFASLVPDSSAKALSRYTEMVDDIIRTQAEKLQQGSELTRVRLKEMDLPDSILSLEGNFMLPTNLKEDVEAVQISGGPAGLAAELQQLMDLRRVNHELLVQTEELLQKEATEDAQFRSQFGTRWTRPQSSTLTKNLQDRLNRFAANLKQASDSDARIERSVRDHSALMSILDRRPIESALPTLARPIMSLDANEDAIVGALKQSLRQLETLGAQRAGLEDMLKEMKRKDDVLPKLMTSTGSYEDLFRKEIAKYDPIREDIAQNIEAQEHLLLQIQAQNEEFSAVFNLEDYKASREKCYKQIQAAIAKYREIKENINEGLKFYVTLQDAITNIKQQCSDFVMTRNIQCREMIEDVQRQMAGLSFQDRKNTGSYSYPAVNQPHQRSSSQPPSDPQNVPHPRSQTSYYQPPEQSTVPAYAHPPSPYTTSQQPPPYHIPAPGAPYPPPQAQQPTSQEYGQPAYPGWRGPYYNAHGQQPGSHPRPPYTIPGNNHFNKNCSVQADFPPYGSSFFHRSTGRFTNGRTVADFISQFLGIEFQKPFLEAQLAVMNGSRKDYPSNGINFASAGSGVLQATNQDWGVISIQQQLRQFQALVQENQIDKNMVQKSLILVESGSNDIFNYFLPYGTPTLDPGAYVQAMLAEVGNLIDQIYKLGARRIALFSLGPVGCVPARALLPGAPVDTCFGKMNLMVKKYNKGLESLVDDMPIKYPGAAGVFGAVYDIVQRFRAIPAQYRFSDVTNACCGDGTLGGLLQCGREGYKICPNPNAFLFWDYFHPTEHAYKLISKALWGGKSSRIRPVNLKTLASTP